jgi:hypothetical protein
LKTLILFCPATFGNAWRQRFPNSPCVTNLVSVAEIAGHKPIETTERDQEATMESLCEQY